MPERFRKLIYRRVEDGALFYAHETPVGGPVPPGYVTIPAERTPDSLMKLVHGHRAVFAPGESPGVCRKLVVDSLGPLRANVHEDENVTTDCRVRNHMLFEYAPGPFGRASIEIRPVAEPVILEGCSHVGFGIALCGYPVMLVVAIEEDRIGLVETRGHGGYALEHHAYVATARVDWYFDRALCERESIRPPTNGCGG